MNWKRNVLKLGVRSVLVAGAVVAGTGCISYRSTGAAAPPKRTVLLTGSNIPVPADSATQAAAAGATPVIVYTCRDIERTGAVDLAGVLQRVPSARLHR